VLFAQSTVGRNTNSAAASVPSGEERIPLATTASDGNGEIVEMSPFVVLSEKDTGYVATDSLAGTRFRTPLKDIAASISVVTKDLMDDLGVNTLEDLLIYTAGTEVMGIGGNYSGSVSKSDGSQNYEDQRDSASSTTRVRGLASADQTRNFFLSPYIPMDGYNTQSITVNRGANAILFGFGSPAGIVENSLITPVFKNRGNVRFSFGSYDTHRLSLDIERVLWKNKLSVRFAMLDDNRRYEQKFSFRDQERYYGAITFKPFKGTSIRVNGEHGHIDQRMPRIDPPIDSMTTWWDFDQVTRTTDFTANKILDPSRGLETAYQRAHNLDGMAGNWDRNPGFIYYTASDSMPSDVFVPQATVPADNPNPVKTYRYLVPRSSREIASYVAPIDPLASFQVARQITDRSIFDYRTWMIDGPNSGLWIDFDAANIVVEQIFLEGNAGVEFVYDYQHSTSSMNRTLNGYRGNNIFIDANTTTIDGQPNPNFGRPFLSSSGMYNHIDNVLETYRATAFFRHDFTKKGSSFIRRLFGVQSFNGMYSYYERDQNLRSGYNAAVDPSFRDGLNGGTLGTSRKVSNVVYLGPSMAGWETPAGAGLTGVLSTMIFPETVDVLVENVGTNYQWTRMPVSVYTYEKDYKYTTNTVTRDHGKVESAAFIWQGNWMDNMLVSTLGWRKDTDKTAKGTNAGRNDSATGALSLLPPIMPDYEKTSESTFSYGFALHIPPRWFQRIPGKPSLSLYYNKSENFDVGAGVRIDIVGDHIAPQQGKTEEYGFRVAALNNKVNLRVTWYETTQDNMTDTRITSMLNRVADLEMRITETKTKAELDAMGYIGYDSPAASELFRKYLANYSWKENGSNPDGTRDISITGPVGIAEITRSISKGVEIEAVYNPTRNWRILLNAARQEAVRGDTSALLSALIAERLPQWQNPQLWQFDLSTVQRVDQYVASYITGPLATAKLSNGEKTAELREWRVNLITNYSFDRESFLKGWGVGGAMRWEDSVGLGYPVIDNPVDDPNNKLVTDVKNPFMGPSLTTFDAWLSYRRKIWRNIEWKIQLNIRNLFNKNLFIPVKANPVTKNDLNTYEVAAYRIGAERTYEITSTFSF
jgi:outer membrane receptor protein involved in Fe transport